MPWYRVQLIENKTTEYVVEADDAEAARGLIEDDDDREEISRYWHILHSEWGVGSVREMKEGP